MVAALKDWPNRIKPWKAFDDEELEGVREAGRERSKLLLLLINNNVLSIP